MFAYAGKILYVNLTTGQTKTRTLTNELAKAYLGGVGLGIRLLMGNSSAGTDPLHPDNPLIFATGPLTGTLAPTGGSCYAVVSKSPATGGVGESVAHGFFGPELKRAGYDAIVITGKASRLAYLWIDDETVEIRGSEKLRNKPSNETEQIIQNELGDPYVRIATIGEAGEKLCRFASIVNDGFHGAERTGLGAVMGSKNLKAIAIRGSHDVGAADFAGFREFIKIIFERMKDPETKKYTTAGTPENVAVLNALSALPTRNWTNATFTGIDNISGEELTGVYVKKIVGCATCGMPCDHIAVVPDGPFKGVTVRLTSEGLWSMGPLCGIDQLDVIIQAIHLANMYGLDVTSTGVTVAFAMDLYEHGILTRAQTNGLELKFGNADALLEIIQKIGTREGWLGNVLAEGTAKAAELIGKGAENYACHIKGLEVPGYDIRSLKTAALAFSISYSGASQLRSNAATLDISGKVNRLKIEPGRGKIVLEETQMYNVLDSLILCNYSRSIYQGYTELAKYYTLATGIPLTAEELTQVGDRIENLARLFNIQEGKGTRKYDTVPYKIKQPVPDRGPTRGVCVTDPELQLGLDNYYAARGWTKDGVPTVERLQALGLADLASIVKNAQTADNQTVTGGA
jgi:aldehyde:ferredoxin oxidoreductase